MIGVTKAYCTRVGGGPFPTELENETGEDCERSEMNLVPLPAGPRCGWIDLVALILPA